MKVIIVLFFFSLLFSQKNLDIKVKSDSIVIDGTINELEWENSVIAENFVEINPGNNSPAKTRTKVLVSYDTKNLYVAFHSFDNPELIRANQSKRDDIEDDDRVIISIDPRNDGVVEHYFSSNPFGNQLDGQKFGNSDRNNWDAIWYSSGRIVENGYEVEIAIPFSTFRSVNTDELHWRINFSRFIPRKEGIRMDSWMPVDRDNTCSPCQFGHIRGMQDVEIQSPIELLPSLVGSSENSFSSSIGFGIAFPIGKSASAEVTLNPDFSQV